MRATIIAVGTELLFGQIVNSNAAYISKELQELNIDVMYHYTVGDNPFRLKEAISRAFEDTDLIITTGGLGPTQDDLTKEVVCEALGEELVLDEKIISEMRGFFKKLGKEMTKNNEKQAYVPQKGITLHNQVGTAPGIAIEKENKIAICLPGPPREMKDMFLKEVKPFLETKGEGALYYKILRTIGIGESALETELLDIINNPGNSTIATYAKEGECALRVTAKMNTLEEAKEEVERSIELIKGKVGEYIYSYNDIDLQTTVCNKLLKSNISISSAESCTGGGFAKAITDIAGISKIFDRGLVTYSNQSKTEALGVKKETLDKYGAVSEETAMEMVEGLYKASGSQICISVTGVAGPAGGTIEKPVGLAYIGLRYEGKTQVRKLQTRNGGRTWIRNYVVLQMFSFINDIVSEEK